MHAFIIEDEQLIARSIEDMLEDLGFTSFSFARSEDAAVFGAGGDKIDLITADVRLLPGDGLRAVEEICKRRKIPAIFITGYAEELEERAPGVTVIQKPIKAEELAEAVRNVMGAAYRENA
ncbi:MAG TPA: response regulator [Allosphingosinicella sp.]|uniref:response regulator n=1 Tax=Allosphingosinicella sp. TaxID=2823234 RepID=UPI002EDB8CD4